MKIGILTFHCAHNYGAVLQCYALQETLKNMGHEVEVINYKPKYLITPYKIFNIKYFYQKNPYKLLKRIFTEIEIYKKRKKRYNAFNTFINKKLNLSTLVAGHSIPKDYNLYIVGSDQVWNRHLTQGLDPIYWGNFERGAGHLITYAASMEAKEIDEQYKVPIINNLKNFDYISVREKNLQEILQKISKKKIELVIDPTLLVNSTLWNNLSIAPPIKKKYVLIYQFAKNINTINIANKIASEINADVLDVNVDILNDKYNKLYYLSPEQLLGYFKNASFIITSTFHGTAFSVIFNKPFYYIKLGNKENYRVNSLLENIGLSDRIISEYSSPEYKDIKYIKTNKLLNALKNNSIQFLEKIIHNIK